jgi:hypothetical protein
MNGMLNVSRENQGFGFRLPKQSMAIWSAGSRFTSSAFPHVGCDPEGSIPLTSSNNVGFVVNVVTLRQVTNSIEYEKQSCRLLNFATMPWDIIIKRHFPRLQIISGWYHFTVSHYFKTVEHVINKILSFRLYLSAIICFCASAENYSVFIYWVDRNFLLLYSNISPDTLLLLLLLLLL